MSNWNLSDGEKQELRALLPKISDKNFGVFTRLVDDLIIAQLQISPDEDNSPLTPGELKRELKKDSRLLRQGSRRHGVFVCNEAFPHRSLINIT